MQIRPLCPELADVAHTELNEDSNTLETDIKRFREWIKKQPHLRARIDDQWLATFLRGSKFNMDKAQKKIDLYYSMKHIAPDLNILKHTDAKFMEILKLGVILVLPKTAHPADPRVVMVRAGQYNPKHYSPAEIMSIMHVLHQIMYLEDDNFIVTGAFNIIDLEGGTFSHLTCLSPMQLRRIMIAGQDAAPVRMKGAHFLNTFRGFELFFNIIRSFMNKKNKKRFYMHTTSETLYNFISKDTLPAEYGGNGGTVQEIIDYWVNKIDHYSTWLVENDTKYGTDETKRPGKNKTPARAGSVEPDRPFIRLEVD